MFRRDTPSSRIGGRDSVEPHTHEDVRPPPDAPHEWSSPGHRRTFALPRPFCRGLCQTGPNRIHQHIGTFRFVICPAADLGIPAVRQPAPSGMRTKVERRAALQKLAPRLDSNGWLPARNTEHVNVVRHDDVRCSSPSVGLLHGRQETGVEKPVRQNRDARPYRDRDEQHDGHVVSPNRRHVHGASAPRQRR